MARSSAVIIGCGSIFISPSAVASAVSGGASGAGSGAPSAGASGAAPSAGAFRAAAQSRAPQERSRAAVAFAVRQA